MKTYELKFAEAEHEARVKMCDEAYENALAVGQANTTQEERDAAWDDYNECARSERFWFLRIMELTKPAEAE